MSTMIPITLTLSREELTVLRRELCLGMLSSNQHAKSSLYEKISDAHRRANKPSIILGTTNGEATSDGNTPRVEAVAGNLPAAGTFG